MLNIYKPWMNNIEGILENPKDTFTSHLLYFMKNEDFSKPIFMELLRVKIAMRYVNTEETNFGIVSEHTPTVNCNNEVMADVEEAVREPIDNINSNEYTILVLAKK